MIKEKYTSFPVRIFICEKHLKRADVSFRLFLVFLCIFSLLLFFVFRCYFLCLVTRPAVYHRLLLTGAGCEGGSGVEGG